MRLPSRVLVAVSAAAVVTALAGCTSAPRAQPQAEASRPPSQSTSEPSSSASSSASAAPPLQDTSTLGTPENPVRVAIVGDSLTAGGARTIPRDGLDQNTWMTYARGDGVKWVGGWAMGGTTTEIEAEHVRPIHDVDVLVLMSGTNNVRLHISFERAKRYYERIVRVLKPKHVIIGAIPPYDRNPTGGAAYERKLKKYVLARSGWTFVDPWSFARDGELYRGGVSNDGIHPTTSGYRIIGREYRDAILQSVSVARAG